MDEANRITGEAVWEDRSSRSPREIARVLGSSFGTQPKKLIGGYWYKQDQKGYEGLAEYLVSHILLFSNADHFVLYEQWEENGRRGCRSKDFLEGSQAFVSFARIFQMYTQEDLGQVLLSRRDLPDRIRFVREWFAENLQFDITGYLSKILSLDALTLNVDRHLNNLGVIMDPEKGSVSEAPIFDNGAALLSDFSIFDPYDSLVENIEKAKGKPFFSDLMMQAKEAGFALHLDYEQVYVFLDQQKPHRAIDALRYQMEKYENLFRM